MRLSIIYLFFTFIGVLPSLGQVAQIQIVHCSADSALSEVDVWIDSVKVFDNVSFRTSTSLFALDTNTGYRISICNANSNDTIGCLYSDSLSFNSADKFQLYISGSVSNGYTPLKPLTLTKSMALRNESNYTGYSDFIVFNGSSDIGKIDLAEITINNNLLANDLDFATGTEYNSLESFNYILRLRDSSSTQVIREIAFNLGDQMLSDSAFTLVLTGFVNRSQNLNGPALSLSIVRSQGGVFIPLNNATASLQIIHNSADPSLTSLDFYVNGNLIVDQLKYRNATGYLNVPSGIPFELSVAPANSSSVDDSLSTYHAQLESGKSYVSIVNGLGNTSITPFKPLSISTFESKKSANTGYNCEIAFAHGATDLDAVFIDEVSQINSTLFNQTLFGEITDYQTIPAANYEIILKNVDAESIIKSYRATLSQLGGEAQTWILSGFVDTNQSDSTNRIGIFTAKTAGGPLIELNSATGIDDQAQNRVKIQPNPSAGVFNISGILATANYNVYSIDGTLIKSGIASSTEHFNLESLVNGIYYLSLDLGSNIETHRLVISK